MSASRDHAQSTTDGQGEPALAASDTEPTEEWCVIEDDHWTLPRYVARRFIRQTAKTFHFEGCHKGEKRRDIRCLLLRGLSQANAERAAERLTSSRSLCEQERVACGQRHAKRVADIVSKAISDGAGNCTASTLGDSGGPHD